MQTYLLKTEPLTYSFADLASEKRCTWDGVTNPGALIHLRAMRKGDEVFVYHTGDERAIVGLARVARGAYPDPARPELNDAHEPKYAVVDLVPVRAARTPLSLATLRTDKRFASFALLRQGRLSVMPVPDDLAKHIRELAGF